MHLQIRFTKKNKTFDQMASWRVVECQNKQSYNEVKNISGLLKILKTNMHQLKGR